MINRIITTCNAGLKGKISKIIKPKAMSCNKLVSSPIVDEFIRMPAKIIKKCFPDFEVKTQYFKNYQEYIEKVSPIQKVRHQKRMELFASKIKPEPRIVSKKQMKAIDMIQWEMGEYCKVQTKLKEGLPLNETEEKFLKFITESMEKTAEPKTLWRFVTPYESFCEQIKTGEIKFNGMSSTASQYTDFFGFWESCNKKIIDGKLAIQEGYMFKINVKPGTPILDCNAIRKPPIGKTHFPRMSDEVILPEGKGLVQKIDEDLKIIEVDFYPN